MVPRDLPLPHRSDPRAITLFHRVNGGEPAAAEESLARRLLALGLVAAVAAAAAQTVLDALNIFFLGHRDILNVNEEGNVFSWASSTVTFSAAFVALVHAVALPRSRSHYALLFALLASESVQRAAQACPAVPDKVERSIPSLANALSHLVSRS